MASKRSHNHNSRPKFFQEEKNSDYAQNPNTNIIPKDKYNVKYFDAKLRELNIKIKILENSAPSNKVIQELKERYNKLSDELEPFEKEFDKIKKNYLEREIRNSQLICAIGSVIFGLIAGFGFGLGFGVVGSFVGFILATLFFYCAFYYGAIVPHFSGDRTDISFTLTEGVEYDKPIYSEPFKRDETGGVVVRDETGTDFAFKVEKFFKDLNKFENDIIELESIIEEKKVKCKLCDEKFNSEDEMYGWVDPGILICYVCEDHLQQGGLR